MTGNLPVVPSRESLSASGKFQSPGSGAARAGGAKNFFAKNQPGAKSEPFSQQASRLQNSIQKDGHFSPVTSENRGGAASPSSGARVAGSGKVETNNGAGATSNRGPANDRPSTGATVRGSGTPATNPGFGSAPKGTSAPTRPSVEPSTRPNSTGNNGGWQKFSQPSNSGAGRSTTSPNGSYRPPLNMNKPIVTQRPNGGFGGNAGRPSSSPSYGAPSRPTYSAPSRPTYSAPSRPTYSAPSRPTYSAPSRPSYSAPSRPSYSAPRQSAPSYHAPSGGGSHAPSGGGSRGSSGGGGSHSSGGGGGHPHR